MTDKYTEKDIGKIVEVHGENGSSFDERIVLTFCKICGARFIGTIREAGGFIGGHEMFHAWEFQLEMETEMEV